MNRFPRFVMGLAVVSILVPAMALTTPDLWSRIAFWSGGDPVQEPTLLLATSGEATIARSQAAPEDSAPGTDG